MPTSMALPHIMYNVVMLPGKRPVFRLAVRAAAMTTDPNAADFHVPELELPAGLSVADLENRESLLNLVNAQSVAGRASPDRWHAGSLLRAGVHDSAFRRGAAQLEHRPGAGRRSRSLWPGRSRPKRALGPATGRGRRRDFVSVYDKVTNGLDNWDTHVNNFGRENQLLPPSDTAYSARSKIWPSRGLLDSTLVVWIGEFGRTRASTLPGAGAITGPTALACAWPAAASAAERVYAAGDKSAPGQTWMPSLRGTSRPLSFGGSASIRAEHL